MIAFRRPVGRRSVGETYFVMNAPLCARWRARRLWHNHSSLIAAYVRFDLIVTEFMRRIEVSRYARSSRRLPRSGLICSALDVSPIALDIWRLDAAPHRRV